jgi:glycosyltransferase involved in cell wall biosynthesis
LRAFDIFALASRKEGFPLYCLEAMQAGLPIIATDVGGNKEALGNAGILIPPNDPNTLTQALVNLISDSNLQAKLSSAKRRKFSLKISHWINFFQRPIKSIQF